MIRLMPMISCREATEHHSRKMDGALGLIGKFALRKHLGMCPVCAETAAQLDLLRKAMRSVADGDSVRGERLAPPTPPTSTP